MFSNPEKNLKTFEIGESMIVADLGAGTGFYTVAAGKMVPRGKVYAIEIQKAFLETIIKNVKDAHLNNVECFWGNIEKRGGTKLGDGTIDRVIVSSVFFQVEDKNSFVEEVRRILKPEGKVLIIEHSESSHLGVKSFLPKERIIEMFEKKGFAPEREIDAGEHHYGIIMIKK